MTFKEALEQTRHLEHGWRRGLQALRAEDSPHIQPENPRRLRGSADIDAALRSVEPNAHRWDFGIAYQHSNRRSEFVYWVELHTASESQINKVVKKAQWLLAWLKDGGRPLARFDREILWVSSGATTFTLTAPKRKQMAEAGLIHKGLILRIPNQRSN